MSKKSPESNSIEGEESMENKERSAGITSTIIESDPNMFFRINSDAIQGLIKKSNTSAKDIGSTATQFKQAASTILADGIALSVRQGARPKDKLTYENWLTHTEAKIEQLLKTGEPVSLYAIQASMIQAGWTMSTQPGEGTQKVYQAVKSTTLPGKIMVLEKDQNLGMLKALTGQSHNHTANNLFKAALNEKLRLNRLESKLQKSWPLMAAQSVRDPMPEKLGQGLSGPTKGI